MIEKKLKKFLTAFWWVLGLSLIATVFFFMGKFWSNDFSNFPEDWGVFGDYFGGITQAIIALANLVIFVKLTNIIAKYQQEQSFREMKFERAMILHQLRHESIKQVSEKLNSVMSIINNPKINFTLLELALQIESFVNQNHHLFPTSIKKINVVESLMKVADIYDNNDKEKPGMDRNTLIKTYYNNKENFIRTLQEEVIADFNKSTELNIDLK